MKVKIVRKHGKSYLIEFNSDKGLRRVYVPTDAVKDEECSDDAVSAGIPHGIPWEDYIKVNQVTSEDVANELRRNGIWTADDLHRNPHVVTGVVGKLIGINYGKVLKAVRTYKEDR